MKKSPSGQFGGDRTRKRKAKRAKRRRGVSIQEFEATRDAVEDLIKRMIRTDGEIDKLKVGLLGTESSLKARMTDIDTKLKRLDEIDSRLKRLEERSREVKP